MTQLKDKIQNALDECRMLIMGGQVLISFAAEAVLEPAFAELSALAKMACLAAMTALTLAVGLLMWPAAYHRIVCKGNDLPTLHRFTTRAACCGLMPFGLGLSASMYVIGERVSGTLLGTILGLAVLFGSITAWYIIPILRSEGARNLSMNPAVEPTALKDKVRHVLTEARMVLPGAQALLGFGSISVLMDAFKRLPHTLKLVHVFGVCCIALAVLLLMMPAAYHRIAENGEQGERFHRIATGMLLAAMAALAPGMAAAIWIVWECATGNRLAGIVAAGSVLILFYGAWFGWTALAARREARRQ